MIRQLLFYLLLLNSLGALAANERATGTKIVVPTLEGFTPVSDEISELIGLASQRERTGVLAMLLPLESIESIKATGTWTSDRSITIAESSQMSDAYIDEDAFTSLKADMLAELRPGTDPLEPHYSDMERKLIADVSEIYGEYVGFEIRSIDVTELQIDDSDGVGYSTSLKFAFKVGSEAPQEISAISSNTFLLIKGRLLKVIVAGSANDLSWVRRIGERAVSRLREVN